MEKKYFEERYALIGGCACDVKIKKSFRINSIFIDEKRLLERMKDKKIETKKIPFANGFYYESPFSIASTQEYLLGYIYIQEAASMMPVEVLAPKQNELILDMTAAPGSKTTQLADIMKNRGQIIALDNDEKRCEALKNNIERLGIKNTDIYNIDALKFDYEKKFDKILLDAPCSGNYALEKNWFSKRNIEGIMTKSEMQKKLAKKAHELLKKDGILVYSVCSLEPEECEEVVDFALKNGFEVIDTGLKMGSEGILEFNGKKFEGQIKKCRRFWPHKTETEGFFVAKLRKK